MCALGACSYLFHQSGDPTLSGAGKVRLQCDSGAGRVGLVLGSEPSLAV